MPNSQVLKSKQDSALVMSRGEQIEYIADLIAELKEMARTNRLATLAGILELAHAEAQLRAKDVV